MAFGKCQSCELLRTELNEWKARHDKVMDAMLAMRANGASLPQPAKITPPMIPAEERAMVRAHDEFVDEAAKHLAQATGVPIARARIEAERLRREIDGPMDQV
jgi:hypothetical protein